MEIEELNKDLLKLSAAVSVIEAEIKKDNESRKIFHDDVKRLLNKHNDVLFGNGRQGLVTLVEKQSTKTEVMSKWAIVFITLILGGQAAILIKMFLS